MSVNADAKNGWTPVEEIKCFNKCGALTIPIVVIITWSIGISYCGYIGGGWNSIEFGDFATHPTFMLTAFLLFGSLAISCRELCKHFENQFSEQVAIHIHMSLNTLATVFGWIGWYIIYELHKTAGSHYKGSHSRIGIFALCLWTTYWLMGLFHYVPPCSQTVNPTKGGVQFEQLYRAGGICCIIVTIWAAALGAMWEEYSFDIARNEYERSRSGVVLGGILLIIFLVVGMLMYARTLLPPNPPPK